MSKRDEIIKRGKVKIHKCRELYNNLYFYDMATYERADKPIKMICPYHGEFWMSVKNHLRGHRCPKCAKRIVTLDLFKYRSNKIHGNKYNYDLANYIDTRLQERDLRKKKLCQENGIELVYYLNKKFLKYTDPNDKCFTSKDELLKYIKSKMESNYETTNKEKDSRNT